MPDIFPTGVSSFSPYCSAANTLRAARSSGQILGSLQFWCPASHKQPESYAHVQQVPGDAMEEGGPVGAGEVIDLARKPTAERHAQNCSRKYKADPGSGFAGREMVTHDQGIARNNATLG